MSLPDGTVTFLFTDIDGSTRLLQRLGDDYGPLVARHRRIMRESAADARGSEIDAQGDGFLFTFTRARDAVNGALAAQRRLAAETWPDDTEVRVRMGLHTGEPTLGEEGYLGLDVVLGARIAAAAHGGQVLLSESTRVLLPADLPDGAEVIDLGQQSLKDLDRPVRLYQLVAPGLSSDFPAPRTGASAVHEDDLQRQISAFVASKLPAALEGFEVGKTESGAWMLRRRRG